MSNPELNNLLADDAAKVAAMTEEERSEYLDQIVAIQRANVKPYTEGERQARAMRPAPTLGDAPKSGLSAHELDDIDKVMEQMGRSFEMAFQTAPNVEAAQLAQGQAIAWLSAANLISMRRANAAKEA